MGCWVNLSVRWKPFVNSRYSIPIEVKVMRYGFKLAENIKMLTPLQSNYLMFLAAKYTEAENAAIKKATRRAKFR